MKADQKVVQDLQVGCGLMATLAEQYRVDAAQLEAIDLDFLAHKFYPKWHQKLEHHIHEFLEAIIAFGGESAYLVGQVSGGGDVRALLTRECVTATNAWGTMCVARKNAWNARADYVPDLWEHAIHAVQKQIETMERELELIKQLGAAGYVSARLENG